MTAHLPAWLRSAEGFSAGSGEPSRGKKRITRPAVDEAFEAEVAKRLRSYEVDIEARRRADAKLAGESFALPAPGRTLADALRDPRREEKYVIDRLLPANGNAVNVAQHKAGKTTLALNLVKSLADDDPFLGRFDVTPLSGRIAFWNYELDRSMFLDWAEAVGVRNTHRVTEPWHLRGVYLPFWLPEYGDRAVDWLRREEVEFLVIDTAARAARGLIDNENDNSQMAAFTDALDALKREAGVSHLLLTAHTGRAITAEDEEHSRGATRLEDWMDAGWYLTKDKAGRRSLRAFGRDVELEAMDLAYDGSRRHLTATGVTRDQRRATEKSLAVVDAVYANGDPPSTSALGKALKMSKGDATHAIRRAEADGYIERRYKDGELHDPDAEEQRTGVGLFCHLTARGESLRSRRVRVGGKKRRVK